MKVTSKATQFKLRTYYDDLKGETFAGFKIQRQSVFYLVIDVASVILSMYIVCTVCEVNNSRA